MTGGLRVQPHYTIKNAPAPNVIVVPAHKSTAQSRDWLARASAGTDVTMSVCTGAFQLARAGLLKGIAATTHHDFFDSFAKEFPDIELRRGLRFVDSGRIATAGGLTSGIDLALHIVSRYFGVETASATAAYMEYSSDAWRVHHRLDDCRRLDLDLGAGLDEPCDYDDRHRGKVAPEDLSVAGTDRGRRFQVLLAARDIPGEPDEMLRSGAGASQHVDDVEERLASLRREIVAHEPLFRVPADLPGDVNLPALRGDAVRVAARARPARRLQDLTAHRRISRPITSFCTSLAPS